MVPLGSVSTWAQVEVFGIFSSKGFSAVGLVALGRPWTVRPPDTAAFGLMGFKSRKELVAGVYV